MPIPSLYPLFLVSPLMPPTGGTGVLLGAEIAVLVSNELVSAVNAGSVNVSLPNVDIIVNMQNEISLTIPTADIVATLPEDLTTEIN